MNKIIAPLVFVFIAAAASFSCSRQGPGKVVYSNLEMVDFFRFKETPLLYTLGLEGVEHNDSFRWRWARGPRTYIAFLSDEAKNYCIKFEFNNTIEFQTARVTINGEFQRIYNDLPATPWVMVTVPDSVHFKARPGLNVIEFEFSKYNQNDFMPGNKLPIAVNFRELKIFVE